MWGGPYEVWNSSSIEWDTCAGTETVKYWKMTVEAQGRRVNGSSPPPPLQAAWRWLSLGSWYCVGSKMLAILVDV